MGARIVCDGNCLQCPYPEMPKECVDAAMTYEDYLEQRRIEREIISPKTRKQKLRCASQKRYYEKHKEEVQARSKRWRERNREYVKQRNKKYYQEHKDEYSARGKYFYYKSHERRLRKKKEWREKNPTYFKDYYQANKERIKKRIKHNQKVYRPVQAVIREARLARGWTQKDLAQVMGLHVGTIASWEKGQNPANWEKLYKVMPELLEVANGQNKN